MKKGCCAFTHGGCTTKGAALPAGGGALAQAVTRGSIRVEADTILAFKLGMSLKVEMQGQ